MRILVLQTTRMGDVLQTTPLVRGIRRKYPDAHITFMVRNMGKLIAERDPDVDEVIVYNEDDMFLDLKAQDSDRLLRAYESADALVQQLKAAKYDLAYNTTHSIGSAMLMKLAGIPEVIGAHLSDDWQFVLRGPWPNYFFTSVFHREYNDLNLCDISGRFLPDANPSEGLVFGLTDEDRAFAANLLEENGVAKDGVAVCFQLGASEENKRWAVEHFARLGKMLAEAYGARIFLVGVKEEEPLGDAFREHAPGVAVPLYGKTSLSQLAAILERSTLLVSNDTGTMHVAAAVKCPVVLASVGHVHFRETGPYGAGHRAVEWRRERLGRSDFVPGGLEERSQILPEHLFEAVRMTIEGDERGGEAPGPVSPEWAHVDMFTSAFAPDGCLEWYPSFQRPITQRDFLRVAYRAMWLDHLKAHSDARKERESVEGLLGCYASAEDDAGIESWSKELSAVFEELASMAKRGIGDTEKLLDCLKQPGKARIAQQTVRQLVNLDEEMRVFGELHSPAKPLILISRFERDNLEGSDPLVLAKTTLDIYRDCFARARLMARKIQRVAGLWQQQHPQG